MATSVVVYLIIDHHYSASEAQSPTFRLFSLQAARERGECRKTPSHRLDNPLTVIFEQFTYSSYLIRIPVFHRISGSLID